MTVLSNETNSNNLVDEFDDVQVDDMPELDAVEDALNGVVNVRLSNGVDLPFRPCVNKAGEPIHAVLNFKNGRRVFSVNGVTVGDIGLPTDAVILNHEVEGEYGSLPNGDDFVQFKARIGDKRLSLRIVQTSKGSRIIGQLLPYVARGRQAAAIVNVNSL